MFERNRPLCARGSRPWSLILYLNIYRTVQWRESWRAPSGASVLLIVARQFRDKGAARLAITSVKVREYRLFELRRNLPGRDTQPVLRPQVRGIVFERVEGKPENLQQFDCL